MAPSISNTQLRRRSASLPSFTNNKRPRPDTLAGFSSLPVRANTSFACIICHQTQDTSAPTFQQLESDLLAVNPPKTTNHQVCSTCQSAILDLSICWACGECIVRGNDVVSLGWCFWHRLCFGCLVCNTPLAPPLPCSASPMERMCRNVDPDEDDAENSGKRRGAASSRCTGVELDSIPLCPDCEKQDENQEIAAEYTPDFGGGDNQSHHSTGHDFVVLQSSIPQHLPRRPKVKGATGYESELERFINRSSTDFNDLIGPNVSEAYCNDHYTTPWQFGNDKLRFYEDGSTEEPPVSRISRPRDRFMLSQITDPDHDTLVSRQFASRSHDAELMSNSPRPQSFPRTPPVSIPKSTRSKTSRISFADTRDETMPLRAHTIDSLYSSSPSSSRSPINRYPTPFPRIKRPSLERSDCPNNYFNRSISNHACLSHSAETVDGMLTLAQFAEHTSILRKSSTIPYSKLAKAYPLLGDPDMVDQLEGNSTTSPFSDKFAAKTPEPIGELVERRRRDLFKPAFGLVAEIPGTTSAGLKNVDGRIRIDVVKGDEDMKRKVVVNGKRSRM